MDKFIFIIINNDIIISYSERYLPRVVGGSLVQVCSHSTITEPIENG